MIDPKKAARGEALAAEVRALLDSFGVSGERTASYMPRHDVVRVRLTEGGIDYPVRAESLEAIREDLLRYARRRTA
jgi:hypothetical protein